jgi:pimeloyl-ACP methyl ester carboxylesterase
MKAKMRSKQGIAYEERGEGFPFIALHGYSLDRRMSIGAFEPSFAARSGAAAERREYRRIYPDLPFMGESADRTGGSGHEGFVDALCAFIDEVAPDGRILLSGQSYGGYLSRSIANRLGDRVAGLFLLCPSIIGGAACRDVDGPAVLSEETGWREAAAAEGASEEELAGYETYAVSRSLASFRRYRDEILAGIRIARLAELEAYYAGRERLEADRMGAARAGADPAEGAFDRVFEGPACFFLGRQDSSTGWRDALRLAALYPRASYVIANGAGHNAQTEVPVLLAAAFASWLDACESAA